MLIHYNNSMGYFKEKYCDDLKATQVE